MTTTASGQPIFGRRGNGSPQRSRIVAAAPVSGRSAPAVVAWPSPGDVIPKPSMAWTLPAANSQPVTSAIASALKRLSLAATTAVQKAKDFGAARAAAKVQVEPAQSSTSEGVQVQPTALQSQYTIDEEPALAAEHPSAPPNPKASAFDASEFDILAELETSKFDFVTEIVSAPSVAPSLEPVAFVGEPAHGPGPAVDLIDTTAAAPADAEGSVSDEAVYAQVPAEADLAAGFHHAEVILDRQLDEPVPPPPEDVDEEVIVETPGTSTALAADAVATVVTSPSALHTELHSATEHGTQFELFAEDVEAWSVTHAATPEDRIWARAYFLASAVAFPTAIALMAWVGGPTDPVAGLGFALQMLLAVVSPLLGLVFFLPAVALVRLTRFLRIPRGLGYPLTGALLGSVWLLISLYDGVTPSLATYCLIACGLLGGLVFWRTNRSELQV